MLRFQTQRVEATKTIPPNKPTSEKHLPTEQCMVQEAAVEAEAEPVMSEHNQVG